LEAVRKEAARIVQEAHGQAAEIRRAAEQAGRKAASEAANRVLDEKVGQRVQTVMPALQKAVKEIADQRTAWQQNGERILVRLAMAIAERVVRREIERQPEISLAWIRESLELAAGASSVTLRMNPQDLEALGGQVDRLAKELGSLATPRIVPDESIVRGGCSVNTEFGSIDAQIATQIAQIEDELK
jgi:flagellar biosynthesis/type III secretory pathway protein FliH